MKTEIIEEQKETPDYPAPYKTKKGLYGNKVVLMTSEGVGTLIVKEDSCKYSIGHHANNWDMDCFEKITTPITIKFGG